MLLTDAAQVKNVPKRIISLVPSLSELLHYLQLEEETIAVTKFCIHPTEWFRTKIKIGGTKNINTRRIKELRPDLIIANKEENVREQVEELAQEFNVWLTDVNSVEDACAMIKDIGSITGKTAEVKRLLIDTRREFSNLTTNRPPLKTAYLIWRHPYMTIGGDTFINDMMLHCGLHNVFSNQKRYPKITVDDIKAAGCNLIILSSEPYPFKEKHMNELQQQLPGIKIILADGEMFSWYGSRMLHMPGYLSGLLKDIKYK
jgi:ABC-type Fe3+-hydroxamate transport system substrate-binding protein